MTHDLFANSMHDELSKVTLDHSLIKKKFFAIPPRGTMPPRGHIWSIVSATRGSPPGLSVSLEGLGWSQARTKTSAGASRASAWLPRATCEGQLASWSVIFVWALDNLEENNSSRPAGHAWPGGGHQGPCECARSTACRQCRSSTCVHHSRCTIHHTTLTFLSMYIPHVHSCTDIFLYMH